MSELHLPTDQELKEYKRLLNDPNTPQELRALCASMLELQEKLEVSRRKESRAKEIEGELASLDEKVARLKSQVFYI